MVSMFSLLENVSEKINIHIIHNEPETLNNLPNKISNHELLSSLEIHKFESKSFDFPNIDGTHVSEATYYRFFIENFIDSSIENIIYLDSDIVCINDPIDQLSSAIKELSESEFFIAVKSEPQSISENLNLKTGEYFNAGVMVIKTEGWFNNQLANKLVKLTDESKQIIQFWDQDILNIYFDGSYIDLSKYMNFSLGMVPFEKNNQLNSFELDNVKLIHYVGKFKPWSLKGIVNAKSEYYQSYFRSLFNSKYHLQSSWKVNTIKDLITSLKTGVFFKAKYPFNLLVTVLYSLIKINKKGSGN